MATKRRLTKQNTKLQQQNTYMKGQLHSRSIPHSRGMKVGTVAKAGVAGFAVNVAASAAWDHHKDHQAMRKSNYPTTKTHQMTGCTSCKNR